MPDTFVPLVRSAAPMRQTPFPTLLVKIVRDVEAPLAVPSAAAPSPAKTAGPAAEPKITLVKDGEAVTGVHVQCSCGKVIELVCDY